MAGRVVRWWRAKTGQVKFAYALLVLSLVGWPVSALTLARDEPPFILALSWLAISITALDAVFTSRVHAVAEQQDDEDGVS